MKKIRIANYQIDLAGVHNIPERPVRLVHLGDLHNRNFGEDNLYLVHAIRSQNPDVIVMTGDMVLSSRGKQPDMEVLLKLAKELTKFYPIYFSMGNHEARLQENPEVFGNAYARLKSDLVEMGVCFLDDTCEIVNIHEMQLAIWGYSIKREYFQRGAYKILSSAEVKRAVGESKEECYNLLLAHNPVYFAAYARWGADLTLSGHLHGGMIRLPYLGGIISPQIKLFPKYDRGIFEQDHKKMIVTAGLGTHSGMIRINNPAEIGVIDLCGRKGI